MTSPSTTAALLAVAKDGSHAYSCEYLVHFRDRTRPVPFHHHKKWEAARQAALRSAPACDCHLRLVYAALAGIGVPYPGGIPEWLENGPDFEKEED